MMTDFVARKANKNFSSLIKEVAKEEKRK